MINYITEGTIIGAAIIAGFELIARYNGLSLFVTY